MKERFVETIERLTGRTVMAFMSANHQEPDLALEIFVLDPERTDVEPEGLEIGDTAR
jgi:uncharacterized protein YbcI